MIENLINRITTKFYDDSDDEEEIEVFKYGLEAIISSIIGLGLSLFLCFIIKEAKLGAMFILILTPIKLIFTSYHCNHRYTCFMTYSAVVLTNIYLYYYIDFNMLLTVGTLFVICILRQKEMTVRSCFVIMAYLICIFLFNEEWKLILSLAIYTELLLIIMCEIKKAYYNRKRSVTNQSY